VSAYGRHDDTLIRWLEALSASWTPEESAYYNERFRELGRKFARYLQLKRNAERARDDWLATTRIAWPETMTRRRRDAG
jgi:hypothetical protein